MNPITLIQTLLSTSRKAQALYTGGVTGAILYAISAATGYYGADKVYAIISTVFSTLASGAAILGAIHALMTTAEDCARKWGVTSPIPIETSAHAKIDLVLAQVQALQGWMSTNVPAVPPKPTVD